MASLAELEDLDQELRKAAGQASADKLIKYLRLAREVKVRDSEPVARYGSILLRNYKKILPEEELWLTHEQVAIAAIDCAALPFAASLIRAVAKRFPQSSRTRRLQGMYWEALGDFDRAEELYKDVLQEAPTNEIISKRLVALEKSRGNTAAAIEALKKYLDTYSNDREGWEELAELYLEGLMYRQALFCYEELITFQPNNPNYIVRYADILCTLGGNSNYRMAKAYYAKAVELTGGQNVRALYGITACCANITDKVSLQDSRSRAQIELPALTTQALARLYKRHAPEHLPLLQEMLQQQGLIEP